MAPLPPLNSTTTTLHQNKTTDDPIDSLDSISSLPDAILHIILFSIPTKSAIRTSVLSKRWRHVWYETPSISIDIPRSRVVTGSITKTLGSFSVPRITSFHLRTNLINRIQPINSWIEFGISHQVENLSLVFCDRCVKDYRFPDFFYINSTVKQLCVDSKSLVMNPKCTVSWPSLTKLCLSYCKLSDESIVKIVSGCPLLENLELLLCNGFRCVDLSESPRLRRLEIDRSDWYLGPTEIVAPHIKCLRLRHSRLQCSLADISSLIEADLNVYFCYHGNRVVNVRQDYVLELLKMLQNVKKLTLGATFLQMLSLVELSGVSFPTLKVESLTIKTMILQSVIPGITKILQNSPGLRKLTLDTAKCSTISEMQLDRLNQRQCWRSEDIVFPGSIETISMLVGKYAESNLVASFMERLLRNTKSLETMVLLLEGYLDASGFEELVATATTLAQNHNNVCILIKQSHVENVS